MSSACPSACPPCSPRSPADPSPARRTHRARVGWPGSSSSSAGCVHRVVLASSPDSVRPRWPDNLFGRCGQRDDRGSHGQRAGSYRFQAQRRISAAGRSAMRSDSDNPISVISHFASSSHSTASSTLVGLMRNAVGAKASTVCSGSARSPWSNCARLRRWARLCVCNQQLRPDSSGQPSRST